MKGGNVFFVGAGTSGRLGVIEAAELPPTFGVDPNQFIAIMAGGFEAIYGSVEGAEDDEEAAVKVLEEYDFGNKDLIIALSASGSTPFVIGALKKARQIDARTISIICNSNSKIEKLSEIPIVVETGPEVVAGSTRMSAGTAQKLILNMLTTTTMIRLGKVYDGYMVGVQPSNQKLKKRATRILSEISGLTLESAENALEIASWDPKVAIMMTKTGLTLENARKALQKCEGSLRLALKKKEEST